MNSLGVEREEDLKEKGKRTLSFTRYRTKYSE